MNKEILALEELKGIKKVQSSSTPKKLMEFKN